MFKDYEKYLSISMKVYLFVLVIIFILKIVGLDYFGIDYNNSTMLKINNFIVGNNLENIYYALTLYIYVYLYVSLSSSDNSKRAKIYSIIYTIFFVGIKFIDSLIANTFIIFLIEFVYTLFFCLHYTKFKNIKNVTIKTIKLLILNTIFQLISLYLRNIKHYSIESSFLVNSILDLDYLLMFIIYQKYLFSMGGENLCGKEVFLFSLKKINLRQSLKKLQRKFQNSINSFKEKIKEEKITFIIFFILSAFWNVGVVMLVLFVAFLNDTFIECVFILTSFWLSKGKFGKPFHFDSMSICFIVSNLSYFVLNRITAPLGISIIIPVLLGVGLSYVTSKFVKKTYKPLYRGMPEEIFEDTISKVTEKDSVKYKICKEFYIDNESDLSLSFKYNYSVPGIRKIKERINDKIKGLN